MEYKYVAILVVILFSAIHFIEVLSFLARVSGVRLNYRATAYVLQNSVFMLTRFFTMAFLPLLGYLVDVGIDGGTYLTMMTCSLAGAAVSGVIVLMLRGRVISAFGAVLEQTAAGTGLIKSIFKFPLYFFILQSQFTLLPTRKYVLKSKIFWLSSIVFAVYSLSVLYMFYLGLYFPQYRMTISQMSGIVNAFGAVLLSFVIEPRISIAIDSASEKEGEDASGLIFCLLLGRIFGVGVLSQVFIRMAEF